MWKQRGNSSPRRSLIDTIDALAEFIEQRIGRRPDDAEIAETLAIPLTSIRRGSHAVVS